MDTLLVMVLIVITVLVLIAFLQKGEKKGNFILRRDFLGRKEYLVYQGLLAKLPKGYWLFT